MLSSLHIKNIALIDDVTINLGYGLNILSGETGAGKSIIIDSLNFVLGERADKTLIRYGADSASVEAVFSDYENPEILEYLNNIGIENEGILIIYRIMSVNGRNQCRINGRQVTLNTLKGLTELMADIHGQHEHQSLLNVSTHIALLDNYGGKKIEAQKSKVESAHKNYDNLIKEYKKFGNADERMRHLDILKFQIDELEKADLKIGEEDELLIARKKFRNIEKILNAINESEKLLNGGFDYSIIASLNEVIGNISSIIEYDENLPSMQKRLESAKIDLKDIADSLSNMANEMQFDDFTAEKVEKRLELVRSLMKKYGGTIESAIEFLKTSKKEYEFLSNADELCVELEQKIKIQGNELLFECGKLHELRKSASKTFETKINTQLADLGMKEAIFSVEIIVKDDVKPNDCTANGYDTVEFLISTNKGEPKKPLAKIVSGGEMSRFMLALKNIIAKLDNIQTMVFDEIDTGISGNIAQVVAQKLYNISTDRQVIAVTHLPQLASMADLHYKIEKSVEGEKTNTHVYLLKGENEINEIARLIGGSFYSTHAIPHAKEMKTYSNNYKKSHKNA